MLTADRGIPDYGGYDMSPSEAYTTIFTLNPNIDIPGSDLTATESAREPRFFAHIYSILDTIIKPFLPVPLKIFDVPALRAF